MGLIIPLQTDKLTWIVNLVRMVILSPCMCLKISNKFTLSETDAGRKERDQNYRLRKLEHLLIKTITSRPGIHFHTIPLRSHYKMRLKGKMQRILTFDSKDRTHHASNLGWQLNICKAHKLNILLSVREVVTQRVNTLG